MPAPPRDGLAPSAADAHRVALQVSADEAAELYRTISALVSSARRQLAAHHGPAEVEVVLDLSSVDSGPVTAPLLCIHGLLRRAVGPDSAITLTGVSPVLTAGLVAFGLPDGVVVRRPNRSPMDTGI